MTIAISLKVNDGLVLAADSASTLLGGDATSGNRGVVKIYNNANKIFNLRKGFPIGAITWGAGSIGPSSISTLAKDLRKQFTTGGKDWQLECESYTVEGVAEKVKRFMFEEHYVPTFKDWPEKPQIGFIVAGYSPQEPLAEEYQIDIVNGECKGPRLVRPKEESGVTWSGQPEAITRLVFGFSPLLSNVLKQAGVPENRLPNLMQQLQQSLQAQLVMPAMPFQDAIDLAEFLVDLTIKFARFLPGTETVGGPIEVAAISKHEGFKWIRRKHYYSQALNP